MAKKPENTHKLKKTDTNTYTYISLSYVHIYNENNWQLCHLGFFSYFLFETVN